MRKKVEKKSFYIVTVSEAVRYTTAKDLKEAGLTVETSGYSDGSTTFSFLVYAKENEIRKAVPGASITETSITETEDF